MSKDTDDILNEDHIKKADQTHYQALLDAQIRVSEQLDKTLITLSGGALVLSITFLDKLVDTSRPESGMVLLFGWALLISCICLTAISILFSKIAIEHEVENEFNDLPPPKPWSNDYINTCTWLALLSLIVGFGCLGFFSWSNLKRTSNMEEKVANKKKTEEVKEEVKKMVQETTEDSVPLTYVPKTKPSKQAREKKIIKEKSGDSDKKSGDSDETDGNIK